MPLLTNEELDRLHSQVAFYMTKWIKDHRRLCTDASCQDIPHMSDEEIAKLVVSGAIDAD